MIPLRGLRARILLLLLLAVAPIVGLAVLWSVERGLAQQRFQAEAAAASLDIAVERLGRVLDQAAALRTMIGAAQGERCAILAISLPAAASFDTALLITANGPVCGAGKGRLEAGTVDALRVDLASGGMPGLAGDSLSAGQLAIGLPLDAGATPDLLVLRVSAVETERILDLQATPFLSGLALMRGARPIVERHLSAVPAGWWPAPPIEGSAGPPGNRASARYFAAPVEKLAPMMMVGLGAPTFIGSTGWPLATSLALLVAILSAAITGAIWAIDRSVLRWINYLRRIAVAHSRGHHSVRVKRLASIPRELADLGDSLNLMANDAGRRVALLRESAAEKSALLLELHHRVKNNFQVTTSLLSLLRLDMPAARRDEIRFVEDFVCTMAVAYRVAYDSGDVTGVTLQDLLRAIVEALRDLAGAPPDRIFIQMEAEPIRLDLDTAISLGLYFALTLPPYLDTVAADRAAPLSIAALRHDTGLRLVIAGIVPRNAAQPPLRHRLRSAYLRQLKATLEPAEADEVRLLVPLDGDRAPHRLAALATAPAIPPREAAAAPSIAGGWTQIAAGIGLMLSGQGIDLCYRWASGSILFGQDDAKIAGRNDGQVLPAAAAALLTQAKLQVLADGAPCRTNFQIAGPATERYFAAYIEPMLDRSGRVIGVLTACQDVTEHKAAEQRMMLLLRDMTHRSKNVMAVTEAMARQSLLRSSSLEEFGEHFSTRLHSLANSHDLLTRRDWDATRLSDLLRSQLGHYLLGEAPQIALDGPDIFMAAVAIPYIGLALHELSTNAAKHGALSADRGQVAISWHLHRNAAGEERICLSWIEAGGPPVVPPTRHGFGADVTQRIISRALHGEVSLDFAPGGIVWQLDAPARNLVDHPSRDGGRIPDLAGITGIGR